MDIPLLTSDTILQEDAMSIARSGLVDWNELRGRCVLVTGATGLIGCACVRALVAASAMHDLGLRVLAGCRDRSRAESLFAEALPLGVEIVPWDVRDTVPDMGGVDFIVHAAAETTSRRMVEFPVDTILTAVEGTRNLLDFARDRQARLVFLSSMEVYGTVLEDRLLDEHSCGLVDPLAPRSGYPESKRLCESLCVAYARQYGCKVSIARLVQTLGPGISPTDNRVFPSFVRSIVAGQDIVLHTAGSTARCYCYVTDAVRAILMIALRGERGEAYNVCNPRSYASIREVAEMLVRNNPESGSRLVFDIPDDGAGYGYAPDSKLRVDASRLIGLGWRAEVDLPEMLDRMIRSLQT